MQYHVSPYAAHLGAERTIHLIKQQYWWPTIHHDVKTMIDSCVECKKIKLIPKSKSAMQVRSLALYEARVELGGVVAFSFICIETDA
jgi:hypothetical protein